MDVHVKEEILNEANIIVKDEQHDYSVTVPLSDIENSRITQLSLKREYSNSEKERTDCACEVSTKRKFISSKDEHCVKVKFEEDENAESLVAQIKVESESLPDDNLNLPDDCIDSFFSDNEEKCDEEVASISPGTLTHSPQDANVERPPVKRTPIRWTPLSPISREKQSQFLCRECGKTFPKHSDLKLHQIEHKSELRPYINRNQCLICGQVFTHNFTLKAHESTHRNEKIYPALSVIEKEYLPRERPKRPQLDLYPEEKNWYQHLSCSLCRKTFSNNSALKAHQDVYCCSFEKTFICFVCKQTFTAWTDFQQHKQTCKPEPRTSGYTCFHCRKPYAEWKFLEAHLPYCRAKWKLT